MSSVPPHCLLTIGRIAQDTARPIHVIQYVIRTRGIQPVSRAGRTRVFSPDQVEAIRRELNRSQSLGGAVGT